MKSDDIIKLYLSIFTIIFRSIFEPLKLLCNPIFLNSEILNFS